MYISNTYSKVITWRSIDAVEAIRSNGGVVGYTAVLIDRFRCSRYVKETRHKTDLCSEDNRYNQSTS